MKLGRDEWLEEVLFQATPNYYCNLVKITTQMQAMDQHPTECAPESMDSEDDLFIIFTSGVTESPKGVIHSQAGYLLHVAVTHKV